LDRVSTGSGNDLVSPIEVKNHQEYRCLITYQVATAPCTDPIQEAGYGHGNKPSVTLKIAKYKKTSLIATVMVEFLNR